MSQRNQPAFDAAFWFQWIVATTLGWFLGRLVFANLPLVSEGVGVGIMQWPILYRRIPNAWQWALVTAAGWLGGSVILLTVVPRQLEGLLAGLIVGPCVGFSQWLVLRRELRWAGWWIVISTLAWITGLTLIPGILATGALAGAFSGVALILLSTGRKAA
jgi:hypothetical protein